MKVLKSSSKQSAARISLALSIEFYSDMKATLPFFKDWRVGEGSNARQQGLFSPNGPYWDRSYLGTVIKELKRAGWIRHVDEGFYHMVTRADGSWPIRLEATDGKLTVDNDTVYPHTQGVAEIHQALKSAGIKFVYRDSSDSATSQGNDHSFRVLQNENPGLTFQQFTKVISHALARSVQVTRPTFVHTPYGSMKLIPRQKNRYTVEIGNVTWYITNEKGVMSTYTGGDYSAQRTTKTASRENSAPLPTTAYDYYRLVKEPFAITCPTGRLRLVIGDIFGVRPSTSGKMVRLIRPGAPGKVYSLDMPAGKRLADMSRPYRGKVVHASAEE